MNETMLTMRGIVKYIYGSDGRAIRNSEVKILDRVDFDLRPGEVHLLVGENGAGKSTLMKILGGLIPADEGELSLDGHPLRLRDARDARDRGIAFIHQELNLCPNLDVGHNIFLGREPLRRGIKDTRQIYERSRELLASLTFDIDPRTLVSRLSTAQQQVVEIAKAISYESRIIIMDEPTASLTKREIDVLFQLIARMKASGMGIIYISHRFEEFGEVGDRISVMRDGKSIGTLPMSEFDIDRVIQMMAGGTIADMYPRTHEPGTEVVLEVRDLRLTPRTKALDLVVRKGEVVGLGGLVGAGRTELAKSIFGARKFSGGEIRYFGASIKGMKPRSLIQKGIAYLSEDRKLEGLVLEMNIRENLTLSSLAKVKRLGLISPGKEAAAAARMMERLSIVARSAEQTVGTLSGGNQQRCVLGKWLATQPRLLILDEPTRGVDVNAKAEIHRIIDQIAASGVAILMISSELPELIGMSDRIYVMREGTIVIEVARGPGMSQEKMVEYICLGCD